LNPAGFFINEHADIISTKASYRVISMILGGEILVGAFALFE